MPNPGQLASNRAGSPFSINGAVEQKIRYIFDPRTGGQTIRTFHGAIVPLNNLVPYFQQNGWATDLHGRSAGPEWELVCTIGLIWGNSIITDNPIATWEITSNKAEVQIVKAQNPLSATLSSDDIKSLNGVIQNPPSYDQSFTDVLTKIQTKNPTFSANAQTILGLIMDGIDSTKIFYPVLTQNQITSNVYDVEASFQNVGCIISTSELVALLPNVLAFSLPSDPAYGLPGFQYGWLKNYPNVTVAPFNKTQIRQEYEFGLWPTSVYIFV